MNCAVCYSRDVGVVLDLGEVALAGAFLKPGRFATERFYPLRVGRCRSCLAVQVLDRVAPHELYGDYFYRSSTSASARAHFRRYAEQIVERFRPQSVIEVGCNDGVMLRPLAERVPEVIGVDPSRAASVHVPGAEIWRSYFTRAVAKEIGKADLIVANNVFAHVENISELMHAVMTSLNSRGVFVFECHYLGAVLDGQYDAIYHEHVFYHSLISLQRLFAMWSMEIFDVEPVDRHGGSMRYYVGKVAAHDVTDAVAALAEQEWARGFHRDETFERLHVCMQDHRRALMDLLNRLKRERCTVAGYGAAGRANALMQWCGIDSLAYVVDDCESKHGYHTPGTHFEIRPPAALQEDPPDWLLVLAWTYHDEIAKRCAGFEGHVISPLPEVSVTRFTERMVA